jgi:hypothetical protein
MQTTMTKPLIPGVGRHATWGGMRVEILSAPILSGAFNNREPVYYCSVFLLDSRSRQWVKCSDLRPIVAECQACPLKYHWGKGHHVVDCTGH